MVYAEASACRFGSFRIALAEEVHELVTDGVRLHPVRLENRERQRPFFAQQAKQEVLGADVVVSQALRLFRRVKEDPGRLRAERNLDRRRHPVAPGHPRLDFTERVGIRQVRAGEKPSSQPDDVAQHTEEEVLGFNRVRAEVARLVPGKEQRPACAVGVAFEHVTAEVAAGFIALHSASATSDYRLVATDSMNELRTDDRPN
jgi:hypothetical protein